MNVSSFTGADLGKDFIFIVKATTSGGTVRSGEVIYRLAAVPGKPNAPLNIPSITNDERIGISFGETMPDNGGSEIISIQLWMDDA